MYILMKKFYSFLLLAIAGLLSFSASAQVNITIKVDDPSKVVVSTGSSEKTVLELVAGENSVTVSPYDRVNFEAVDGYLLDKIIWSCYVLSSRVKSDYIMVYPEHEGKVVEITTIAEGDAVTGTFYVNVDDPSVVRMVFFNSYRAYTLSEGENTVKFDPEYETAVAFGHSDYNKTLYSVKRNGKAVPYEYGQFGSEIAEGDVFEIKANFPDEKYPISFDLPEGCEDVISNVMIDGAPIENPGAGFEVQAGLLVQIEFNVGKYCVESVTYNGVAKPQTGLLQFVATEAAEIAVAAYPYSTFNITVDVDYPEHIAFYRGYASQEDVVELVSGVNVVEIYENNTSAVIVRDPAYYYTTFTVNGETRTDNGSGISLYDLKEGDQIVIRMAEIIRDKNFVYYIDNMEAAPNMYFSFQRSDYSAPEVATGYNVVPFCDDDNEFYFGWSGYDENYNIVTSFNLYHNGELVQPMFEYGSTAYITVADGDVIKAYTTAAPETYTATFEVEGDAENISVVKDIITEVADWQNGISDFEGTQIDISGAESVVEGESTVLPNDDGSYTVKLTSNTTINVVAGTNGVELIGADAKAPMDVYNAQGILLIKDATPEQIEALGTGFYIVGNHKMMIRK